MCENGRDSLSKEGRVQEGGLVRRAQQEWGSTVCVLGIAGASSLHSRCSSRTQSSWSKSGARWCAAGHPVPATRSSKSDNGETPVLGPSCEDPGIFCPERSGDPTFTIPSF